MLLAAILPVNFGDVLELGAIFVQHSEPLFKFILSLLLLQIVQNCVREGLVAIEILAFVETMVSVRCRQELSLFEDV